MKSKLKAVIGILILIALIGSASLAYETLSNKSELDVSLNPGYIPNAQDNPEKESIAAPDFTVFDENGNEIKLSDFFGRPIVLNFWASWCPPCKSEMPEFDKVYEEIGDRITFIIVDLVDGSRETKESGEKFVLDQGFTFPVYYDTSGEAGAVYGISSIPTTFFIDRNGSVITGAIGAINEKSLRNGINLIE